MGWYGSFVGQNQKRLGEQLFAYFGQFGKGILEQALKGCNAHINFFKIPLFVTYNCGLKGDVQVSSFSLLTFIE